MPTHGKFLVDLVHGTDQKLLFFGFWFGIVAFFSYLMYSHYKKTQERNFKKDSNRPLGKGIVVKKDNLPK